MNNSEKRNNTVRSNFGAKGWWIIIFSALNWMFYGGLVTVSMNTVVPQLAARIGAEAGTLLAMSTPAGIAALFVCLFAGKIIEKKGVKLVNGISLIIAAFAVFIWAQCKSVLSYTISLLFVVCSLNVCQLAAGNTAISNWFPKKKGLAIGWATMGLNFASAFFVVILVKLSGILGDIKYALWLMSGCLIILSIINFTAFVNYPEQWGAFPDNDPNETRRTDNTLHTRWTTKLVLKQKETWTIGIINGIYAMGTIGFVSTLVMSMMMKGFTQPQAIKMLSISAIIGIFGSYLCGYIDQKLGVNKASIIFGCWVIMGICFYFVPGNIGR